jgi:large subunit ribosomal protein L4
MIKMPKANLYNMTGGEAGQVDLPEGLFGLKVNPHHLHRGVTAYLSNQRLGTQSTKRRGEVSGTGKKPFKQKGTGMARQGTLRAPQMVHGGVAHGPKPRDFSLGITKKMKRQALFESLSDKALTGRVLVVESLRFDVPKTKQAVGFLKSLGLENKSSLIVLESSHPATVKSFRNIPTATVMTRENLNVFDVLKHEVLVLTQKALEMLAGRVSS